MLQELMFGHHSFMRDIIRFSARHRIFHESDAEHTFNVVVYTEKICEYLNRDRPVVDMLLAMRIALHHDLDETITGDILRTAKNISEKLEQMQHEWTIEICKAALPRWLFNIWFRQFEGSPEAQVVQLADWLSGLQYMALEAELGNNWLVLVKQYVLADLKKLIPALPACAPIMPEVEVLTCGILNEVSNGKLSNAEERDSDNTNP